MPALRRLRAGTVVAAMRVSRALGIVAVGSLALLILTWLAAVFPVPFLPATWGGLGLLAASCLALGMGALVARTCSLTFERDRMRGLMAAGMLLAALSVAGWGASATLALASGNELATDLVGIATTWFSAAALAIGAVAVVYRARVAGPLEHTAALMVVAIVGASAILIALFVSATFIWDVFPAQDFLSLRQAILAMLGAVVVASAVLAAVRFRARLFGEGHAALGVVRLRCPRCGAESSLSMGGAACAACGLRIVVEAV